MGGGREEKKKKEKKPLAEWRKKRKNAVVALGNTLSWESNTRRVSFPYDNF